MNKLDKVSAETALKNVGDSTESREKLVNSLPVNGLVAFSYGPNKGVKGPQYNVSVHRTSEGYSLTYTSGNGEAQGNGFYSNIPSKTVKMSNPKELEKYVKKFVSSGRKLVGISYYNEYRGY